MTKKKYITPDMVVVKMTTVSFLAASVNDLRAINTELDEGDVQFAREFDFADEEY